MAGEYEPAARCGHVAAAVEDKVYVWGGDSSVYADVSHDGPDKTTIILKVDILDVKVRNTLILVVSDSGHSRHYDSWPSSWLTDNDCRVAIALLCFDQSSILIYTSNKNISKK